MAIQGISPIASGIAPIAPISTGVTGVTGAEETGGSFTDILDGVLSGVEQAQGRADAVSEAAAVGQADPIDVLTATTEAQLVVQMATVVRNRAVEAFNEIMRMQV